EAALSAYREALRLDAGYRGDPTLVRNVRQLVEDRRMAEPAIEFLARDIGEPAGAALAEIASFDKRPQLRHLGWQSCEQVGCVKKIDRLQSYLLDLSQAKSCEERREVVHKLKELGDARALDALKRAKRRGGGFFGLFEGSNSCMKADLDEAIESL